MQLKNYQIGIVMVGLIILIAIIGFTTHQIWIGFVLVALIVVIGVAGIIRSYRNRKG